MVKHYQLNKPGYSQSWYQSQADRSNPSLVVLKMF